MIPGEFCIFPSSVGPLISLAHHLRVGGGGESSVQSLRLKSWDLGGLDLSDWEVIDFSLVSRKDQVYSYNSVHGLPRVNMGYVTQSPSKIVFQSVSQSTHSESVDGASVRSYHHHSVFAFLPSFSSSTAAAIAAAAVCSLVGSPKRPLPSLIPHQFRSRQKGQIQISRPKTHIPGHFDSVQETGRSSRSAHWPRNGGGTERAPPPNANGGELRRRENREATRSNIRNRRLPDRLVF